MSNNKIIDAGYAMGLLGAANLIGGLLTFVGTPGLIKVSQIFADKERECQENSNTKLADKIAKWAFLVFAAIVGTLGSLGLGLGAAAFLGFVANFGFPIPLIGGIVTAILLEVRVIKNVWEQAALYNKPDLQKTV